MLKVKDGYAKVIGTTYEGSSNYLLLSNGGEKAVSDFATSGSSYTKAESDAKYITNITTAVNKLTFTKNGTNTNRAVTVDVVLSQGRRNPLDERNAISGIYTYSTYTKAGLAPSSYFETLGFGLGTSGTIELGGCWTSGGLLYWRALRDCCDNWYDWKTILDTGNSYVENGVGTINKTTITQVSNADKLDNVHLNGIFTAFGNNAHNITATIGGVTKEFQVNWSADSDKLDGKHASEFASSSHNHDSLYLKWLGNAGKSNMNDIGRISHSSGMTSLSDPGNNYDNPMYGNTKSTSLHLYWQTNYTDATDGSNAWVAQIANKAGTDKWWVRSRQGGTITNGSAWTSNWRFLVTAPTSGLGSTTQPVYINNAGEVAVANSYPSVGNGTITINLGSTKKGSFTVNLSGNTTITVDANTWRPITDSYSGTSTSTSLSLKGANNLYTALYEGPAKRLLVNNEFAKGNNFLLYFNADNMTNPDAIGNAAPDSDWWHIIRMNHGNTLGFFSELAIALNSYNGVYWRTIGSGTVKKSWTRLANADEILNPTNYYWANVKVSTTSSTTTSPTFAHMNFSSSEAHIGYSNSYTDPLPNINCNYKFRGDLGASNLFGKSLYVCLGALKTNAVTLDTHNNLIFGNDSTYSSPVLNTYLKGNIITFLIKSGDSNNYNAFQINSTQSLSNNYFNMTAGATVSNGNFTVLNNSWLCENITSFSETVSSYPRMYVGNNTNYALSIIESKDYSFTLTGAFHFQGDANGIYSVCSNIIDTGYTYPTDADTITVTTTKLGYTVGIVHQNSKICVLLCSTSAAFTNWVYAPYTVSVKYKKLEYFSTTANHTCLNVNPKDINIQTLGGLKTYNGNTVHSNFLLYLYYGDRFFKLPVILGGVLFEWSSPTTSTVLGESIFTQFLKINTGCYYINTNLKKANFPITSLMVLITATGRDTDNNGIDARGYVTYSGDYIRIVVFSSDDPSLNDANFLLLLLAF